MDRKMKKALVGSIIALPFFFLIFPLIAVSGYEEHNQFKTVCGLVLGFISAAVLFYPIFLSEHEHRYRR